MNTIAIIPARGGSKRIPRKNIRLFAGQPLIAYSIQCAVQSGLFDRVVVSTEDKEIAAVAIRYGAEIPFVRPEHLADDHTCTDDVLIHALHSPTIAEKKYDYACCIYATAPFIREEYLASGLAILRKTGARTAFTVTTFPYPIMRALYCDPEGRLKMFWPEHRLTRSQDLPEAYQDAGQFYWLDVKKYLQQPRIFSDNSVPIVLPRYLVQDIDTPEDWEVAEQMYHALAQSPQGREGRHRNHYFDAVQQSQSPPAVKIVPQ
jgi:pseudaminic acid cytidylyltransferase